MAYVEVKSFQISWLGCIKHFIMLIQLKDSKYDTYLSVQDTSMDTDDKDLLHPITCSLTSKPCKYLIYKGDKVMAEKLPCDMEVPEC